MRLSSPWTPRMSETPGTPSERLARALAEDIASGALPPGARIPPHRELAWRLGAAIGTVTKAMTASERRGLVVAVKGRGTFVAGQPPVSFDRLDLSANVPPPMVSDRLLAESLRELARKLDAGTFSSYSPLVGREDHRRALAGWLQGHGLACASEDVIICNGAQHALAMALGAASAPGGELFIESLTYPGTLAIARARGLRIRSLAIDEQGIAADSLDQALSEARGPAPAVLYVTSTLHNPTGATMGLERRRWVADICRKHDAVIIEDDLHCAFRGDELPPIAALAKERTFHVSSLSKVLSPGLRIGTLVPPPAMFDRVLAELAASCSAPPIMASIIMAGWLSDGTATEVAQAIVADSAKRFGLARALLPGIAPLVRPGFHAWLPMALPDAARVWERADAIGISLPPPLCFMADPGMGGSGIRISLGKASLGNLEEGLRALGGIVAS